MWHYRIQIEPGDRSLTVKEFLQQYLLPRRLRGTLRLHQGIAVNGRIVSLDHQLRVGDRLMLNFWPDDFRQLTFYPANYEQKAPVLYENDDLLLLNKPAGMKMHPHSPTEQDTLLNYVAADLQTRQVHSAEEMAAPYMVHRLDRGTSGIVIVAKNPIVVPILNRQLSQKNIQRTYLTWVSGTINGGSGVINQPIGINPANNRLRQVGGLIPQAALTYWTVVAHQSDQTLLQVKLDTGRMHQIRVHLAAMGHPIVGDDLYGGRIAPRLMLHSATIALPLPFTTKVLQITAPQPDDLIAQ